MQLNSVSTFKNLWNVHCVTEKMHQKFEMTPWSSAKSCKSQWRIFEEDQGSLQSWICIKFNVVSKFMPKCSCKRSWYSIIWCKIPKSILVVIIFERVLLRMKMFQLGKSTFSFYCYYKSSCYSVWRHCDERVFAGQGFLHRLTNHLPQPYCCLYS